MTSPCMQATILINTTATQKKMGSGQKLGSEHTCHHCHVSIKSLPPPLNSPFWAGFLPRRLLMEGAFEIVTTKVITTTTTLLCTFTAYIVVVNETAAVVTLTLEPKSDVVEAYIAGIGGWVRRLEIPLVSISLLHASLFLSLQ